MPWNFLLWKKPNPSHMNYWTPSRTQLSPPCAMGWSNTRTTQHHQPTEEVQSSGTWWKNCLSNFQAKARSSPWWLIMSTTFAQQDLQKQRQRTSFTEAAWETLLYTGNFSGERSRHLHPCPSPCTQSAAASPQLKTTPESSRDVAFHWL